MTEMATEARDRRVHRRIAAPARAQLIHADGSRAELPVRDVSLGGVFLFTRTLPAPIGSSLNVEIYLPNTTHVVRLNAEVVRSVAAETPGELLGVGLRFADPTPEQRLQLDSLMLRLLEGPGGERRAYPRVSHRVSVTCPSAPGLIAVLRDLSHGGAGLWVDRVVPFGTSLSLEILREYGGPLILPGVVVSSTAARPGEPFSQLGMRFQTLSADRQAALDAFLEELVRHA
jgi:c-di-GMP-binding flagellar brake protein YcgR